MATSSKSKPISQYTLEQINNLIDSGTINILDPASQQEVKKRKSYLDSQKQKANNLRRAFEESIISESSRREQEEEYYQRSIAASLNSQQANERKRQEAARLALLADLEAIEASKKRDSELVKRILTKDDLSNIKPDKYVGFDRINNLVICPNYTEIQNLSKCAMHSLNHLFNKPIFFHNGSDPHNIIQNGNTINLYAYAKNAKIKIPFLDDLEPIDVCPKNGYYGKEVLNIINDPMYKGIIGDYNYKEYQSASGYIELLANIDKIIKSIDFFGLIIFKDRHYYIIKKINNYQVILIDSLTIIDEDQPKTTCILGSIENLKTHLKFLQETPDQGMTFYVGLVTTNMHMRGGSLHKTRKHKNAKFNKHQTHQTHKTQHKHHKHTKSNKSNKKSISKSKNKDKKKLKTKKI